MREQGGLGLLPEPYRVLLGESAQAHDQISYSGIPAHSLLINIGLPAIPAVLALAPDPPSPDPAPDLPAPNELLEDPGQGATGREVTVIASPLLKDPT